MLNYKDILNMITLPFLVASHDLKILFTNDNCIEFLNLDRSKIHALTLENIFNLDSTQVAAIEKSIASKKTHLLSTLFHYSNEESIEIELTIKEIRVAMDKNPGFYIECNLKKEMSLSAQNLIDLGNQTSHIAHEISNPLAVIKIQCDNFALKAKKQTTFTSEDVLNRIKTLNTAADRVQASNKDLKSLSLNLMNLELEAIKTKISNEDFRFS